MLLGHLVWRRRPEIQFPNDPYIYASFCNCMPRKKSCEPSVFAIEGTYKRSSYDSIEKNNMYSV